MSRRSSPLHNTLLSSMLSSMLVSGSCSSQRPSRYSSKVGYANSTAAYRPCQSQSTEQKHVNFVTSVWSAGGSQTWLLCCHFSSRYLLFYLPVGLQYFFFISIRSHFVSPPPFLVLVSSIMQSPRLYRSLLPPRPSTLLCHASWVKCINMCMPTSVQGLIIFYHQIWILPQSRRLVVCAGASRFPFRNRAPIWRKNSKRRLMQQHWMNSSCLQPPRPCRESLIVCQNLNTVN